VSSRADDVAGARHREGERKRIEARLARQSYILLFEEDLLLVSCWPGGARVDALGARNGRKEIHA